MRRALALLAAGLLLSGCTSGAAPSGVGPARVDVDTPQLQQMKHRAGIDDCRPGHASPPSGGLPDVTLPCFGGGPSVDLAHLPGPLVVNLWASWCGPCRKEMPIVQQFHEHYGDRVNVVGIDYQDVQAVEAMRLAADSGVTYPLLADPQSVLDGRAPFPRLAGLPFWLVVDADGQVVHRQFVAIRSERQLVAMVRGAGVDL